jgi:ATP-binding cassette subfamily B multidrug efflux pump
VIGRGHHHTLKTDIQKAHDAGKTMRRFLSFLRPYSFTLLGVFILIILSEVFSSAAPFIIKSAVDNVSDYLNQQVNYEHHLFQLTVQMFILLGLYLLTFLFSSLSFRLIINVSQNVLYQLRKDIFFKIQSLSLSYFDKHETGDLLSRLSNDTDVINRVLQMGLRRFVQSFFILVFTVLAMFIMNFHLALVSFSIVPFMFLSTVYFSHRARKAYRKTRKTISGVSSELEENISGIKVTQAFSREEQNINSFKEINAANRDANVNAETITAAFSPAMDVLSTIGLAIVIGYGGFLVTRDMLSIGIVIAFLLLIRRFFHPIRALSMIWPLFQSALAGLERIFELFDSKEKLDDKENAKDLPPAKGKVEFKSVYFSYIPGKPVLQDITFTVKPGQTAAFVGQTGAGKTTILKLIGRYYNINSGEIKIDNHNHKNITRKSLRSQMGFVLQDTFLFSDTILENIRYGRLEADEDEIVNAAQLAEAHDFIQKLPEKYNTVLAEGASNLSQGQKQLIAIARAILADPRILILDEATSNVDTKTERLIQKALKKLLTGRTSFVVAHRLSTIQMADIIFVIDKGRIMEQGRHEDLLEKKGKYREIYNSRF